MNTRTRARCILLLALAMALAAPHDATNAQTSSGESSASAASPRAWRWPAALGGKAYEIRIARTGAPTATEIETTAPVLQYVGKSADQSKIAFIGLAEFHEESPKGRRAISREKALATPDARLVPTGELVVEDLHGSHTTIVSSPGHYAITAAWSPTAPEFLAYTFASARGFGLALVDLETNQATTLRPSGVLADYLRWLPSGLGIDLYTRSSTTTRQPTGYDREEFLETRILLDEDETGDDSLPWAFQLPRLRPSTRADQAAQALRISTSSGYVVEADDLLGVSTLDFKDDMGDLIKSVRATRLVATTPTGIVFKSEAGGAQKLNFLSNQGRITTLASSSSTTTYKLPFHHSYSPDLTVTQVGSSLTTKCNVSSHTGGMSYAYDMQAPVGNEHVLAAGVGTVAYFHKSVTCNSADTVGCGDYLANCSSNGGWGNAVILQHADGSWTKYTHLRYGSVLPKTLGRSLGIGCRLGLEGHTGATAGNKNGCGDHLHFQRQTSSSLTGTSTAISFSDATTPLACAGYESANAGMTCIY